MTMVESEKKENKPLNKPMRNNSSGGKKFKVYVKDPKTGNIKKINFGDKNMEIKRDNSERRKSFRARHDCDNATDKTTPKYWSCKFWSGESVTDLLNELVEPENINVDELLKKEKLNEDVFDDSTMKMHPDIRKVLLKNALEFIKFAGIEDVKIKDVTLTGSMANYNWTENSDLDIHILIDFNQIGNDSEFLDEFFRTKKSLWSEKVPAQIKGHDVEVYVQDINESHASTGVYSIWKNDWLTKPIYEMIGIDANNIKKKASEIMGIIDDLNDTIDKNEIARASEILMDKLKKYRKSGLEKEGEFSTENLVFKILRNTGYLENLSKIKYDVLQKELTLEDIFNPNSL